MEYLKGYPHLLSFCENLLKEKKLRKFPLNLELTSQILPGLVCFFDAVLKAENFYLKKNLEARQSLAGSLFPTQIHKILYNILLFFANFRSSLILISDSERQTFRFILENLADYLQQDNQFENNELFQKYKFWLDNFFRFADMILAKLAEQSANFLQFVKDDGTLTEIKLNTSKLSIKLTPFALFKKDLLYFLSEITSEQLTYINPKSKQPFVVTNSIFFEKTLLFLLANLDLFSHPELRVENSPLASKELALRWKLFQKIYQEFLSGQSYESCFTLLEQLNVRRLPFPQLQLLAIKALFFLNRYNQLREYCDSFHSQFPYYHQSFEILGDAARNEKDWEKAVYYYEQSLNIFFATSASEKAKACREQLLQKKKAPEPLRNEALDVISLKNIDQELLLERPKELEQLLEILISREKANALIIGDKGVGKSSLLKLLVKEISQQRVPKNITGKQLLEINFVNLLSGAKYRGQFEEKVVKLLQDFPQSEAILVLEDIHLMMSSSGARSGTSLDFTEILKGMLKKNHFSVIATTNYEEFKNTVERDNALLGFFQKLTLNEIGTAECLQILKKRNTHTQRIERIIISEEVLFQIIESARRDIRDRRLPDSAILILERAVSKARLKSLNDESEQIFIDEATITETLSDLLNLRKHKLAVSMKKRLASLKSDLQKLIIGQEEAIDRVSQVVAAGKLGFNVKKERPEAIFLFVGPTGVGKTELAISLAKTLFGSSDYLLRIDMSEYMEKFTYSRFIGSAPGYVGYYDSNQLTDKIRQNPYLIILLDEIEKADPQILNIFLQVLDAGRLTDARGNVVDFSRTIIIMTSNIGTSLFSHQSLGYTQQKGSSASRTALIKALKKYFAPEFLNRLDEIIVFRPLDNISLQNIVRQQLEMVNNDFRRQNRQLIFNQDIVRHIVERSETREYGAREISRIIKREILEKIAALSFTPEWEKAERILLELNPQQEIEIFLEKEEEIMPNKILSDFSVSNRHED